ncbi:hypothetical protein IMSHALPRED_009189 [Imshaugia aleurites]|uniref:Carboxymuconolactone decarboxylase-like domain-containing protein n=1 Tax=Imshaugia aleurites TaxID=172621 RepID=A0A8H3EX27_9LECA|nr:hypothetical protein IMSHALPRED_009189 [Imshaugia aleurites]
MSRYPPIPPSSLTTEQYKAYDEASDICSSVFGDKFLYKNEDGAFIGPFAPLLFTPTLVDPFFKLVVELGKLPGLPGPAREISILATGSRFKAKYELYAHERVAASTSLTAAQIDSVKSGKKPFGDDALDEQGNVAFDVAMELSHKQGPMTDANWKRAEHAFGKEGAAALIHYVGVYAYTCVLLNGVDAPVPPGERY